MTTDGSTSALPLDAWLVEHREGLTALRRHLHAHPELSWEEHATTEIVAERLELAGLKPRPFSRGTGLVCDVEPLDGVSGPTVALRADIDALAMDDEKDVHYRSQTPGVAHACGHDVHTAVVLGAGIFLAHHRELLAGRVRLVFQPAEETLPGGAVVVIDEGALDGVNAIFGLHCDPRLDVGKVGVRVGPITSASDSFEIRLGGPGGHTARPEQTVDMVRLAADIVTRLPDMAADELDGDSTVKVVFGSVRSGDAANVIPAHAHLRGSVRTPSAEAWETLGDAIRRSIDALVAEHGASHDTTYVKGVPPVVNHPSATELATRAAAGVLGPDAVTPAIHSWGGDDFSWYLRQVPGSYVRLGVRDPASDGPPLDLHAGHFDVDERAIGVGIRLLVGVTEAALADPPR